MAIRVEEMGGPIQVIKNAGKKIGAGVKKGATKVGGGLFSFTPWAGKGWVTRLGQATAVLGLGPLGVACNMPRWSNTGTCRAAKRVSWQVGKRAIEKAYGLPDGSLDQAETILNQAGTDPTRRAAARQRLKAQKIPPDVVTALDERTRRLSWWEQLLASLGF
jgi:hypothetical protein